MSQSAADLMEPGPGMSFGAGLAKIAEGIDEILAAGVTPANADAARVLVQAFEAQARRVDAVAVKLLDAVDVTGTHRLDGHRSAKVMCRHLGRLSNTEATRRQQAAKALRHMPLLAAEFESGRVSFDQVAVVARAFANPRICSAVAANDAAFTAKALDPSVDFRDFDRHVRSWADRMDEDGTIDRFQRHHRNRDARFDQDFDTSWHLSGGCAANDGAEFAEIFRRFVGEQFDTDWNEAKARLGTDDISISDLARTPGQRRWDALLEMGRRAAGTLPGTSGCQVVTNIVMDLTTFERWTAAYARDNETTHYWATTPTAGPGAGAGADDPDRSDYRCETLDGRPVDAATAVADALVGHVRRVVIDERGVVIDQSRKARLFRGNAALAARMTATACYWPGCWHPVTDCQIDHLLPVADHGGPTDQDNGGPCCGYHNRLKEQGYSVTRLADGTIAVHRPDGARII